MEIRLYSCVLLALMASVSLGPAEGHGSCREANLCCPGRDSSCVVHKLASPNTVLSEDQGAGRQCYCDHACLKVGDCCPDFQYACGANDCEVSEWGPWTECSTECGTGTMGRERHVTRGATNGGKGCPELRQKRSCFATRCDGKPHVKANRETAMILPATYSTIRHVNATLDIRNNLRLRYRKDPEEENSKEYCVSFEITKVRKTCENLGDEISPRLAKGSRVCVICESAAMRKHLGYRCQGHGVDTKTTRFTFLAFPQCHGRWQRLDVSDSCSCSDDKKADFIFV